MIKEYKLRYKLEAVRVPYSKKKRAKLAKKLDGIELMDINGFTGIRMIETQRHAEAGEWIVLYGDDQWSWHVLDEVAFELFYKQVKP